MHGMEAACESLRAASLSRAAEASATAGRFGNPPAVSLKSFGGRRDPRACCSTLLFVFSISLVFLVQDLQRRLQVMIHCTCERNFDLQTLTAPLLRSAAPSDKSVFVLRRLR